MESEAIFYRRPFEVNVRLRCAKGLYQICDPNLWWRRVATQPLNQRTWVLQERLLAPRKLHFSDREIFWECRKFKASEMFPGGLPGKTVKQSSKPMIDEFLLLRTFLPPITSIWEVRNPAAWKFVAEWQTITCVYSRCKLSQKEDKLIALSGLAMQMRKIIKGEYLAGLWRRFLLYDLLWRVINRDGSRGVALSSNQVGHGPPLRAKSSMWMSSSLSRGRLN
jgi:hypothetical protein